MTAEGKRAQAFYGGIQKTVPKCGEAKEWLMTPLFCPLCFVLNLLVTLTNNGPVEFAQITNDTLTTNPNGVETITVQAVSTRTDLSAVLTVSDNEANGEEVTCDLTPEQQA